MTAAELQYAQSMCRQAKDAADMAREDRDSTIRAAIEEGWTHAQIAKATGLTRGRVGQLAK